MHEEPRSRRTPEATGSTESAAVRGVSPGSRRPADATRQTPGTQIRCSHRRSPRPAERSPSTVRVKCPTTIPGCGRSEEFRPLLRTLLTSRLTGSAVSHPGAAGSAARPPGSIGAVRIEPRIPLLRAHTLRACVGIRPRPSGAEVVITVVVHSQAAGSPSGRSAAPCQNSYNPPWRAPIRRPGG